jgi:hypothetical protein
MGIARSTYYDAAPAPTDTAVVQAISAVCDEFECYGCGGFAPNCSIEA